MKIKLQQLKACNTALSTSAEAGNKDKIDDLLREFFK